MPAPRTISVTRYLTPLREGGSLPAIVEGDDDGLYVLKFRGAGQGPKALIAEWVAGEIGRAAGLAVPEIVYAGLDPELARTEPDPEVQDLIRASGGLNLALDYLPGAIAFDPIAEPVDATLASRIVWFDAYICNVDRSARNTNLLMWHRRLWLIDHGAALYFHHAWRDDTLERAATPFAAIKDHVLLRQASALEEADAWMSARLSPALLEEIVAALPDAWLAGEPAFADVDAHRAAYVGYLTRRLAAPHAFVEEALRARAAHL
ncbi:MAG: aminotransferase class I and II [Proteobacteria bacterium]|nr:aminotransferase class I and II [Pseudomonadota bacterium]